MSIFTLNFSFGVVCTRRVEFQSANLTVLGPNHTFIFHGATKSWLVHQQVIAGGTLTELLGGGHRLWLFKFACGTRLLFIRQIVNNFREFYDFLSMLLSLGRLLFPTQKFVFCLFKIWKTFIHRFVISLLIEKSPRFVLVNTFTRDSWILKFGSWTESVNVGDDLLVNIGFLELAIIRIFSIYEKSITRDFFPFISMVSLVKYFRIFYSAVGCLIQHHIGALVAGLT